eukprot:1974484-Amphidinium_carterae.1
MLGAIRAKAWEVNLRNSQHSSSQMFKCSRSSMQLKVLFGTKAYMKSYNDTATLVFEGTLMRATMRSTFNVSITLNFGYAGRGELPGNLTAWFRSVAMIVPDYASFGQSMFHAYRCADAEVFKFFKGLAFTGAWCCFDGFNGMCIEVLSVIAQQLLVLIRRTADMKYYNDTATMGFEETLMRATMKPTFNVSIIMSLGYAGRAELPDNLTACPTRTALQTLKCSGPSKVWLVQVLGVASMDSTACASRVWCHQEDDWCIADSLLSTIVRLAQPD